MKILDLNGNLVSLSLNPEDHYIGKVYRSNLQTLVGQRLIERFPHEVILEDWPLPKSKMSLDFFIPRLKIAIEVSPQATHSKHTGFFHGQKLSGKLAKQKNRDCDKARFCDMNNIELITIRNEGEIQNLLK